ncbi:GTP-binding proten HflX [Anabaena cylindrica PCC 7122]|uniref:GTPase HflX n=1 Tax=Anabaena cylindrica (strain ATCC 27899 / PCC 7122) TaxID=272123 RepID=K9Z970_ANACC|nr:GTP-binding proten HflX [Anabaena cylindrica PCC 7122]BAY01854.1 GTP-binding protein HflX [Anabaena cylindrica PCC 7122]
MKSSHLKQLQRLYHQRISGDRITTSEFAQRLAAISTELNQPVCAYLNRRGQVIRVGVGTPRQTQIPPLELPRYGAERLSGIRCIATHLKPEPPNESALTAMALQRLDALVVLNITGTGFTKRGGGAAGYVKEAYLAHLVANSKQLVSTQVGGISIPEAASYSSISPPLSLDAIAEQDFLDLVESLEEEFRREYIAQEVDADHDRVVIVGVATDSTSGQQFQDTIAELVRLVDTAGGDVLQILQQKRSRIHPQTVIGEGKVQEVALTAQTLGANLVVFDRDLSPAQIRNLEAQIGVRVIDRTEVILDIFAQRAQSGAGKLQVELAQLEYMLPRLTGRGKTMSRLGGGIGTRGPGETKLETERRAIQKRISRLQQEVNQLQAHRCRLRQRRQHREVPSVAVVGYTNAGKSTLLNALTNAEVYAADQLFATLDPTTRRLIIPNADTNEPQETLITDTVGFIHKLPPSLMDAFRATLEEVTEADALLHLVDLSHPAWLSHIRAVREILAQMPITPGPALVAFNKIDQVSSEALALAKEEFPLAIFISASQRLGLENLRYRLSQLIEYAVDDG